MNPYRTPGEKIDWEEIEWVDRPLVAPPPRTAPPELRGLLPRVPEPWEVELLSSESCFHPGWVFRLEARRRWGFRPDEVRSVHFEVDFRAVARGDAIRVFAKAARLAVLEMFPLLPPVRFGRSPRRLALQRGK